MEAVRKAFAGTDIYVSIPILNEYREVPLILEAERKINHQQLKALISGIAALLANAETVRPGKSLRICRDEKDNMLLECCLASKADFLITGDKDLLDIRNLPFNLKIITPQRFIKEI